MSFKTLIVNHKHLYDILNEISENINFKVKNIVTQKFFLETMGIIERAKIIEKNMNDDQKKDLFLRLRRLLHKDSMGKLFKVIFAYNCKKNNFLGFS